MSNKVLYRKYRPTKLSEVIGQPQVTDVLENRIKQGNIGHAYLFIGPRGTGKTSVARIFAHAVNDFKYEIEDSYLDIIEIDAASNTGVDNIRELREKAIIAPTKGRYKVYIIDEVHMLTKSASNALLKTLEEPPEHVIFVMATTDAHKVPITISSRAQVFTFQLATPEVMFKHLQHIAKLEHIDIDDDALSLVVRRGGGSFRDSLSLLDQITTIADGKITATLLQNSLGLPQDQIIEDLLSSYAAHDSVSLQTNLKTLLNTSIKPEIIASELISHIIERPDPAYLPLLEQLPDVQPPFPEARLLVALLNYPSSINSSPSTSFIPAPVKTPTPRLTPAEPAPTLISTPIEPSPTLAPSEPTPPSPPAQPLPDSASPTDFAWDTFLTQVKAANSAIYQQLLKVDFELIGGVLHLYPSHKFTKAILDKPNNRKLLSEYVSNLAIEVHDVGEKQPPKDPTLSKISDIMGTDIHKVSGDSPF